jgi:antitoxin component YwqK of YwqJK toxin-antitoxin module
MLNTLNLQKHLSISALCATALLLQGCGSKVDCNGNKVKENALEIIQSHLKEEFWYKPIYAALSGTPELTSVKTLSRNEELKQGQCSAKYTFTYNGKLREIDVTYDLAYLQDKGKTEVKVAVTEVNNGFMDLLSKERPIKNGIEEIFDSTTKNLQYKITWKNGIQDGVTETYNPINNKLIAQVSLVNGQKDGVEKAWSNDGAVLLVDFKWTGGKATGFQKFFDVTGKKKLTDLAWKDGKATGFQTVAELNNGDLQNGYDEYDIKNGLYEGIHKRYSPKSELPHDLYLRIVENYKEGKLDGPFREFGEDGKVVEDRVYKDGIEIPINAKNISPTPNVNNAKSEACLDSKIAKFHKEQGNEALIMADVIEEWTTECRGRIDHS